MDGKIYSLFMHKQGELIMSGLLTISILYILYVALSVASGYLYFETSKEHGNRFRQPV